MLLENVFREISFIFGIRNFSYKFDETTGGNASTGLLIASPTVLDLFMPKLSTLSRCRVNWKLIEGIRMRTVFVVPVRV